jgi:hypothetical protein
MSSLLQAIHFLPFDNIYMDLILREGYWIQFCMKLIAVISHDKILQAVLLPVLLICTVYYIYDMSIAVM